MASTDGQERADLEGRRASCSTRLGGLPGKIDGKPAYKTQGTAALPSELRAEVEALISSLAEHGIFVVEVGQLEGWLRSLVGRPGKRGWLQKAFERLGSDPGAPQYVRPGENDVWAFLDKVAAWAKDPNRKGIPA